MRKVVLAAMAVVALVVGYYFAAPYWTLWRMGSALQEGDDRAFSSYVDFDELRTDLKAQLQQQMMAQVDTANGFETLGMALGMAFADNLLETYISPAGVRQMFKDQDAANRERGILSAEADWVIERNGFDGFAFGVEGNTPFYFERRDLGYQLVSIDFPEEAIGQ